MAGTLMVGDARLPAALHKAIERAVDEGLTAHQVLTALTAVRRQTANDITTGAPQDETLRAMRVVLRGTEFVAPLRFRSEPSDDALALLSACVAALRRLGMGRNRGRGEVECWLSDEQGKRVTAHFERFLKEVTQA